MIKKVLMMILLLGVISVSGCHTAQRTRIRAGYYDTYPYGPVYVDPYPRYYRAPFYPAYFYDPYPFFFFRSDFLFFEPHRHIIIVPDRRFSQPRPSLRGGRRRSGGPGLSTPAPAPQRNLR